jgi:hypothetical protein
MTEADLNDVEILLNSLGPLDDDESDSDWLTKGSAQSTPQGSPARPMKATHGLFSSPRSGSSAGLLAGPAPHLTANTRKGSLFEFEQMEAMLLAENDPKQSQSPSRAADRSSPMGMSIVGKAVPSKSDAGAPASTGAGVSSPLRTANTATTSSRLRGVQGAAPVARSIPTSGVARELPRTSHHRAPAVAQGSTSGPPTDTQPAAVQDGGAVENDDAATPRADETEAVGPAAAPVGEDAPIVTAADAAATTAAAAADPSSVDGVPAPATSRRIKQRTSAPSPKKSVRRTSKKEQKFVADIVDAQSSSRMDMQRTPSRSVSPVKSVRNTPDIKTDSMTFFQMLAFFQEKSDA